MQKIATLVLLSAAAVQAQPFPSKPIRMIVGFTPGSEVDVIGRMIAHEMSEKWGQRVVVDNRPGAGSTVAGAIVAAANADGYTRKTFSAQCSGQGFHAGGIRQIRACRGGENHQGDESGRGENSVTARWAA